MSTPRKSSTQKGLVRIRTRPMNKQHFNYGNVARKLPVNVPPVYEPEYFSITSAPEFPALGGNVTVASPYPPGGMLPIDCGIGVPFAEPIDATFNTVFCAEPGPRLLTVTTAW